jgi:hypothetical protein
MKEAKMAEEEVPRDYTRMRAMAVEMVATVRWLQSNRPGIVDDVELAPFERLIAGELVPLAEIDHAYDMLESRLSAAKDADTVSRMPPE